MRWHLLTTLRLGLRNRTVLLLAIIGLLAMLSALLASEFSGRQPATVALDTGISGIRIIGALLVLFWAQELFGRETEHGALISTLAYPVPRSHYVLGRFFGVSLLSAGSVAFFGLLLAGLGWAAGIGYDQSTPINNGWALIPWGVSLWLDLLAVTAFAWLMASLSTTPFLPFALGLVFAWAGRSLASVMGYLETGKGAMERMEGTFQPVLDGLLWLLPDLSRLDLRTGVLYGQWPEPGVLALTVLNALGYIALLLGLAVWRFNRREFA